MRERSWPGMHAVALVALSLTAFVRPLVAQDAAVVEARIDSLQALLSAAKQAEAAADSVRRVADLEKPVDTLTVGPITVLVTPGQHGLAQRAFAAAWRSQEAMYGDSTGVLSRDVFAFDYGHGRVPFVVDTGVHVVKVNPTWHPDETSLEAARPVAEQVLVEMVMNRLPRLRDWMTLTPVTPARLPHVYRELATVPSQAAQECYQGDLPWCWDALGLDHVRDGWSRWYTEDQRRVIVYQTRHIVSPDRRRLREQCISGRAPDACDRFLATVRPPVPLSAGARGTLVWEALQLGGRGGYARLLANTAASVPDQLAAAARVPPDSLIASWRRRVLAAAPRADADLAGVRWAALLWVVVMAGLAMRSTRWR